MNGEAAFYLLNLAAFVSILMYARHHIHFDKQTSAHAKHRALEDFLSGPWDKREKSGLAIHLDDRVGILHSANYSAPSGATAKTPPTAGAPKPFSNPALTGSEAKTKASRTSHELPSKPAAGSKNGVSSMVTLVPDPTCEQLMYWTKGASKEKSWVSPWRQEGQYITFEPDHGGWNNVRMVSAFWQLPCPQLHLFSFFQVPSSTPLA